MKNVEFDPRTQKIGTKVLLVGNGSSGELRRIGPSYRILKRPRPVVYKPNTVYPTVIEGYDSNAGICRAFETLDVQNGLRFFGGITASAGSLRESCMFYQYLGDGHAASYHMSDLGDWFFKGCDEVESVRIAIDTSIAEVHFPYPLHNRGETGSCVASFDLAKDGLLVGLAMTTKRGFKLHWDYTKDARVTDAVVVDGVWFPTRIENVVWDAEYSNYVTIHECTISEIQLNALTHEDLVVEFPLGAEVSDEIEGTRFKVGPAGERLPSTIRYAPAPGK